VDGRYAAWISVIFLTTSQILVKNSVSAMIGIPAVALGVLSMAILSHRPGDIRYRRFFLVGILFGLSLQAKLYTLLMLPVLLLMVYQCLQTDGNRKKLKAGLNAVVCTSISIAITFMLIAVANGVRSVEQLFGVHATARSDGGFSGRGGIVSVAELMWKSETTLVIFAALSVLLSFLFAARPRREHMLMLFWVAIAIVGLSLHRPLWKHHLVLLIVPLSWAAGSGIGRLVHYFGSGKYGVLRNPAVLSFVVFAIVVAASVPNVVYLHQRFSVDHGSPEEFDRLVWFQSHNPWIVTDAPLDTYRVGKQVPPELALYSEKRIKTGNLEIEQLVEIVGRYNPGQISLRRKITPEGFQQQLLTRMQTTQSYSLRATLLHSGRAFHFVNPESYTDVLEWFARSQNSDQENPSAEVINGLMATLFDIAYTAKIYGYGGVYYHRFGHRYDGFNDGVLLFRDQVVTRPPQSAQQLGQCFLDAYRVIGRQQLLNQSIRVARALACSQSEEGNWPDVARLRPACMNSDLLGPTSATANDNVSEAAGLQTVAEFLGNLIVELEKSPEQVPDWLLATSTRANESLHNTPNPATGAVKIENYLSPDFGVKGITYNRAELLGKNPDGFQSSQDLANQCYAAIRKTIKQ